MPAARAFPGPPTGISTRPPAASTQDHDQLAAERLRQSRVLLVGVGGLGAPAALALAAAGVGRMVLVDFDVVDASNLQRQILFDTADTGRHKLEAAAARLHRLAPALEIETVPERFSVANAARLVASVDLVIDGADNFPTRYLVNDACVLGKRPNVFGSVSQFDGQLAVFAAPGGPCYRCLHPEPPPDGLILNCAEAGVLGVLPGVIGALQAVEAVKLLAGIGTPLVGRLLLYDALRMRARDIVLPRDPACPVCGDAPTIATLQETAPVCATATPDVVEISVAQLRAWRNARHRHALVDVREPSEHAAGAIDDGVLVPLGQMDGHRGHFPSDCPVVLYCRSGARSARAARMLRAWGLDARSLTGGIEAWERE